MIPIPIAAAIGFLEAKASGAQIGEVVAVIGDGALDNGLALSSLNYLSSLKNKKMIIVINDNDMAITKNVGGMAKAFSKMRIKKSYKLIRKLTFKKIRNSVKALVYRNNIFTSLGLKYLGVVDGHDIKSLVDYFEYAKSLNETVVIHVKTKKGKGYELSENDSLGKWHSVDGFDSNTGELNKEDKYTWSEAVSDILYEKVKENDKIRIILPAKSYGIGLEKIVSEYNDRVIDVGINEELAVEIASGMAKAGLIPIVMIYSTFLQRAYDEINNDINRTNNHVIFLVDRCGIVSNFGSTHQGIYDVSFMASLNNFTISMPRTLNEMKFLIDQAIISNNPFVIRYSKGEVNLTDSNYEYNKWNYVLEKKNINILSYGNNVNEILDEIKASNKDIGLINALFISRIDTEILKELDGSSLIIYEEVVKESSLGERIEQYIYENKLNINVSRFYVSGNIDEVDRLKIKERIGLSIKEIISNL